MRHSGSLGEMPKQILQMLAENQDATGHLSMEIFTWHCMRIPTEIQKARI
jgi:hypothetical protein